MSDKDELLALHLAGARLSGERSYALERYKYGNPANHVRFEGERRGMRQEKDEVELLLELWADWMHKPEPITEGYPAKASGGFIESWRKDDEDEEEARIAERIARINAAFDSLPRLYQEVINRKYGLGHQVWRFSKDATFDDAKIVMRVKLVARGLL